jgi:hypothetical protein
VKKLHILIGCDCDEDRRRFYSKMSDTDVCWNGFLSFYGYFNAFRETIREKSGYFPALTLNVRADSHVKTYFGKFDYCFRLFNKHLSKSFHDQDELAWHHHQYRLVGNTWISEISDDRWLKKHISDTFKCIKKYGVQTVHTGNCFQNTATMNAYNDAGIKMDYSALPGMGITGGDYCRYDFSRVRPQEIYVPSRTDYQSPDRKHGNKILEIPTTTVEHKFLNSFSFLNVLMKTGKIDSELLSLKKTHLQITVHPYLFRLFIDALFRQQPDLSYFTSYFHADELLPDRFKSLQTKILYKQDNILHNILYLIKTAQKFHYTPVFVNFKDFYRVLKRKGI